MKKNISTPVAKKIKTQKSIHGVTLTDNYFWMRERDHKGVLEYLNAENDYKDKMLEHTNDLQKKLFEEIKGRIKKTDMSVPYQKNGYTYYHRFEEGKEYAIYCRKKINTEQEEILLDENKLAEGKSYYATSRLIVSPNNKILAFGEDTLSRRIYNIRFINLETGEFYSYEIPNTTGSVAWANDNTTLFYTLKDEKTLRSYKIMRHELGTDPKNDVEIFHEKDETFNTVVYRTKSGRFIMVASYHSVMTEYRFLDTDTPKEYFKIIHERERDHEYSVEHYKDRFFIHTNYDAKNFRLMETLVSQPEKENWKEKIAHRENVLLEGIEIFENHLVLNERINGITEIRIIPKEGEEHYISFSEKSHLIYSSTNLEFNTSVLRFGYTSMTTPNSIYDYDMDEKEKKLLKQQEVISDTFKADDYLSERIWATAKDGVKIPISMVYKKGFEKNGKAPLLLYAYGSYGYSMDPYFSSVRLSLLDRGFAFAIAHIRGGEEMGRQWYENGKMLNKKNTFEDFISCAEFLQQENYTSKNSLFAMGGSAGGLLMGAVMNMRPELWKGVLAAVPFVDVINTMLDESIPLTTGEFDEWGNPKEEKYFHYIHSYCPYQNVEEKDYPATLVTTGYHDSQVQYWEPAKWVAKLRDKKTDHNPLLFYCNMESGHGGASGRFAPYKETAMQYAFMLDLMGITE